jgi:hypothetical protein
MWKCGVCLLFWVILILLSILRRAKDLPWWDSVDHPHTNSHLNLWFKIAPCTTVLVMEQGNKCTLKNCMFCWPCIMLWFLVNDQSDAQFFTMYLFLFLTLYIFRAHCAHRQERQIVSTQPLVTVTLCRWPCRVRVGSEPTCTRHGHWR